MSEKIERCGNCKFYKEDEPESDTGKCRRFPPVVIAVPLLCDLEDDEERLAPQSNWPDVDDINWCGEFRERL